MTEWKPSDGITEPARESAQRATSLLTLALHGITFQPDRSTSVDDGVTVEMKAIVDDLNDQELRELVYSLTSLAVGALRSAQASGGLFGLPLLGGFSPEEWLKQLGINLATAAAPPEDA